MKTSDRLVKGFGGFSHLAGAPGAGSHRLQALLSLGGEAAVMDEIAFWSQVFSLLEQDFGFAVTSVYIQDDPTHFKRRTPLNMRVGIINRIEQSQLSPLVRTALAERAPVFVDTTMPEARRSLISAPARRGVALPLIAGERLLGVVEATSDSGASFGSSERQWLSLAGDQIARWLSVLENTQRLEARLAETNAALARLTALAERRESEALAALRTEWNTYLQRRGSVVGFDLDIGASEQLLRADDLPESLRTVMERGQTMVETNGTSETLSVPIIVRGTLLGAMTFTLPPQQRLTERQTELARGVAERLGTALENSRLFEQTRTLAQRERQANESAARLQGIVDVQTLINLAASDFREVLGAVYTRVSLSLENVAQEVS